VQHKHVEGAEGTFQLHAAVEFLVVRRVFYDPPRGMSLVLGPFLNSEAPVNTVENCAGVIPGSETKKPGQCMVATWGIWGERKKERLKGKWGPMTASPSGKDIVGRVVNPTLGQQIVLGIVSVLAYFLGPAQAADTRRNDTVEQKGNTGIATQAEDEEGLPVDKVDAVGELVTELVVGVPVLESALAVEAP
jgi:hypothetical protein